MKYEEQYDQCFDGMEGWGYNDEESLRVFLGKWGVKLENWNDIKSEFFDLLALAHETGVIRPMTQEEKEKFSQEEDSYKLHEAVSTAMVYQVEAFKNERNKRE